MSRIDLEPDHWMDMPALARETNQRMSHEGILIASLDPSGKVNPMTIGWGVFGTIWGRPMFNVLVRPSRYTYECVEHTGDFTVNVQPADRGDMVDICGTVSGRDRGKMFELGLTPLPSRSIKSPGIADCPLVFECKVVHKNDLLPSEVPSDLKAKFYPDGDFHRVYFGQILAVSVERTVLDRLR
ncbi:MAG: flavin reductase family protein [Phycisphaerae bacterium]|jgi:flavin reductase (DIM6/NTAB) family NADH-FMN oxidoreductase RutF